MTFFARFWKLISLMWLHHEIQISVNSDAKSRETNVRKLNSSHDWKLKKQIQFTPFCIRLNDWIPERTIRENAFEEKKKKPTLKFTPIALISVWTDRFFLKKKNLHQSDIVFTFNKTYSYKDLGAWKKFNTEPTRGTIQQGENTRLT